MIISLFNYLFYKFYYFILSIYFFEFLFLILIFSPLFVCLLLLLIPNYKIKKLKQISLISSFFIFFISLIFHILFNYQTFLFNLGLHNFHIHATFNYLLIDSLNLYYTLGIDMFSLWFIILSTFLIPLCILVSWENIKFRIKEFLLLLFLLEFLLIQVFSIFDLILFYIFFESVLIPMFILIGVWGSRERKIFAAYQFFIYTFLGSVIMLVALIYICFEFGTSFYFEILVWSSYLPASIQVLLWLSFFVSFAVKVPMVPVHVWLPEAHVEAPTAGSVLLAGILLKLGGYGILRFLIPLFPFANVYFRPFVFFLSVLAIIYTSAITIRQVDLKKIIAYSSVAHMNFVTLGLFSFNQVAIQGSIFLMLSHGIISSALFICVGILYDRYKSRLLFYYGGLTTIMPLLSSFFLLFTLANMGLPGFTNFVGELLVLMGVFTISTSTAFFAAIGTILGAVYSIWLYNRIFFGTIQIEFIKNYCDLNKREFFILSLLSFIILFFGIYPNGILDTLRIPIFFNVIYPLDYSFIK